jgi:hypothetical protein
MTQEPMSCSMGIPLSMTLVAKGSPEFVRMRLLRGLFPEFSQSRFHSIDLSKLCGFAKETNRSGCQQLGFPSKFAGGFLFWR